MSWQKKGGGSERAQPRLTTLWPGVTNAWALENGGAARAGTPLTLTMPNTPIPSLSRPYPAKSLQWPGRGMGASGGYYAYAPIQLNAYPEALTWSAKFSWKPSSYAGIEPATATILLAIANPGYTVVIALYVSDVGKLGYYQSNGFTAESTFIVQQGKPYMATLQRTAAGAVRLGLNNTYESFANTILQPASAGDQLLTIGGVRNAGYPWFSAIEDVVTSPTLLDDAALALIVSGAMANTL